MKDKETGTMSKRGIFGTMRSGGILANMFRSDFKNVANTNALYAGGKLYALWEGGKPYMLDPLSLANVEGPGIDGETDLDGLLSDGRTISAHPRYDAEKDVWISFGSQFDPASGRSVVNLYELDSKNFRSTRSGRLSFTNEGPGLLHDFIITKNYMVFNLNKATVSQTAGLKAILGLGAFAEFIAIDEEADDTQVVLIPRSLFDSIDDGSELEIDVLNDDRVSKISLPFFANFHYSNCYEDENGQVVFDTVQTIQRDVSVFISLFRTIFVTARSNISTQLLRAPSKPGVPVVANEELWTWLYPSTLVRYSLDPVSGSVSASPEILTKRPVEFPTVPRDLSSREHRYVYAGASHKEIPGSTPSTRGSGPQSGAVIKVDTHDPSKNEVFTFETFEFVGESVFVQKAGKDVTKPGQEDAGYLVSVVSNGRDMTSDMVIFDAEGEGSITKGPVTKLRLPTFIPQGLHGCFVEDLSFDF